MNKVLIVVIATMSLGAAAVPAAAAEEESLERQLADAQRRLEDAAREVAELSGKAGAGGFREFQYFLQGTRRAMLGVNLGGAEADGGVRVEGVSPGGPAAEAGVKAGDVIVAIEARKVTTGRELVQAMSDIEPGDKVDLELKRAGQPLKLAVEARPLDRMTFAAPGFMVPGTPAVRSLPALPALPMLPAIAEAGTTHWLLDEWGDAEFVTLTPDLGRYFGSEEGVLVARAPDDRSLGLQDGDVIVAIGGREPQDGRHAMRILRSYQPGESVELRILRDRRAQTLKRTIPERARHDVLWQRRVPPASPRPPAPPAPPVSS